MNDNIHRDQRRTHLFKTYNFICVCPACDLSEEQLQVQNKLCDEFNTLMIKKKAFEAMNVSAGYSINNGNTWKELICLKELYKTAKGLKFFRRAEILEQIVEEGFDAACRGYLTMCEIEKNPDRKSPLALVTKKKLVFGKMFVPFQTLDYKFQQLSVVQIIQKPKSGENEKKALFNSLKNLF